MSLILTLAVWSAKPLQIMEDLTSRRKGLDVVWVQTEKALEKLWQTTRYWRAS